MRKKIHSQLWIYFACVIFVMLLIAACLMALSGAVFYHFNFIGFQKARPLALIILFCFFSVIVGTGVAVLVGRRILQPISQLSEEMKQVAEGDFTIQVPECHKIAEVEELFRDFNAMVRELGSIETLRNDFVTNVSHEFKTPLATIRGYVQLLQSNHLSEADRQDYIGRILDSTKQLTTLTENILKLSKIETQGVLVEAKKFRLDEQIRNVILFLEPEWEKRDINWQIDLPTSYFDGNEELLYQVWLNVIDNAIKYSRKDCMIKVQLQEQTDCFEIEVRDTGIGMDQETQKHMFDKFYQGDTARKTKGNGLGLALAKQIVEIYHGKIEVSSEVDVGTAIIVTLPKKTYLQS